MRSSILCTSLAAMAIATSSIGSAASAVPAGESKNAQPPVDVTIAVAQPPERAVVKEPNFDAILGVFDKMFPPQPDPDPARLALARTSVQAMWPDGAYGKLMTGFMGGMFDRVMEMKNSDFASLSSSPKKADASVAADDRTVHDKALAKDPYFDQRMAAWRSIVTDEVTKISMIIDPRMRDGLARAMARRFDAQQLTDINAFFATPSGRAMASQYLQLWLDPDTMRSMMGSVPQLMTLAPDMVQRFKAVDEKFPKPKPTPAKAPARATKN